MCRCALTHSIIAAHHSQAFICLSSFLVCRSNTHFTTCVPLRFQCGRQSCARNSALRHVGGRVIALIYRLIVLLQCDYTLLARFPTRHHIVMCIVQHHGLPLMFQPIYQASLRFRLTGQTYIQHHGHAVFRILMLAVVASKSSAGFACLQIHGVTA